MTAQGSPYGRFLRALGTGNLTIAEAAAAELPRVDLAGAAALFLLMLDGDDPRAGRAMVRLHARFVLEGGLSADESDLALEALRSLGGPDDCAGCVALARIAELRGARAFGQTFRARLDA